MCPLQAIDAVLGEILTTLAKVNWLISDAERVLRAETRPNNILLAHKRCTVYHEPIGVVAALVSWVCEQGGAGIVAVSHTVPSVCRIIPVM